jgi:hypothetical protein
MPSPSYETLFHKYMDGTVISKAEKYAYWTLPQLMADVCASGGKTVTVVRDFQEMGALLVNNLSAKLASLEFPPSRPFYKIKQSQQLQEQAKRKGVKDSDLQAGLSRMESLSCQQLYINGSYEQLVIAMKHLIVTGNVLLYRDKDEQRSMAFGLRSYTLKRDGRGTLMDCIVREFTDYEALDLDTQAKLKRKHKGRYNPDNFGENRVKLYTRIKRVMKPAGPMYEVTQEADEVPVGSPSLYSPLLCPWQAISWSQIIGESYGRGLVEDYAGGFARMSTAAHAAALYGVEVMRVINLVRPGMGAHVDELQKAETGEYVMGEEGAVTAYESGEANKMEQAEANLQATFGRLAKAFMYRANTRDAERVTKFEIQQDAQEVETTLGGVYSSLSASMQLPMAHQLLLEIEPGIMTGVLTGNIRLDIAAGIPALGRQSDVQNLAAAAQDMGAIVPIIGQLKQQDPRFSIAKIINIILAGQSIDTTTVFLDEAEIAEQEAAAQQEALGAEQINQSTTLSDQAEQLATIQGQ